jgi:hypothetical protein
MNACCKELVTTRVLNRSESCAYGQRMRLECGLIGLAFVCAEPTLIDTPISSGTSSTHLRTPISFQTNVTRVPCALSQTSPSMPPTLRICFGHVQIPTSFLKRAYLVSLYAVPSLCVFLSPVITTCDPWFSLSLSQIFTQNQPDLHSTIGNGLIRSAINILIDTSTRARFYFSTSHSPPNEANITYHPLTWHLHSREELC